MVDVDILVLKENDSCPICNLGKGLRKGEASELSLTGGFHNYDWLHCDTCGAWYMGRDGSYSRFYGGRI